MPASWRRMPIEIEAPEEFGYERIRANLSESSCTDQRLGDLGLKLDDLILLYGDHKGHPEARAWLAKDGADLAADDVLLTTGAAMALFLVHSALLGPGDHLIVAHPNYGTNLETPLVLGASVSELRCTFEEDWRVDVDRIAALMTPQTRLISLTAPQNPTGVELPLETLVEVLRLCEHHGCYLLLDQTYRDLTQTVPLPLAAGLSSRAISVSSLSKTDGVPGIRFGWIASADKDLMSRLLAVKEQVVLTGSVLDEAVGYHVLQRRVTYLPALKTSLAARFAVVQRWLLDHAHLEWVAPTGGVTGLPRIRDVEAVDPAVFHRVLRADHAVWVGPGSWFDLDLRYFRIGWGWPDEDELRRGLEAVDASLAEAARRS